ncbi:MAG: hypothetical protein J6C16_01155 [Clostridia bacterium]|nr:hypothetical protein [Clostridia bacterium]
MIKDISEIIQRLFTGVCDIIEYTEYIDDFGITQLDKKVVLSDIPCRVSFSKIKPARKGKATDHITQDATLFISKDIQIKNGSIIKITQNQKVYFYQKTGESADYTSHKEIAMVLKNDYV